MLGLAQFWAVLLVAPIVYWRLPERWRATFLAALSVGFLAWLAPVATAAWVGLVGLVMWAAPKARDASRPVAVTGAVVMGLIGVLVVGKYGPELVDGVAGTDLAARYVVPLGVSYLVFKLVHYAVEVVRGRIAPHTTSDVLSWATLFPAFVAGPIERFDHFLGERESTLTEAALAWGISRIFGGLVKKLFISDVLLSELLIDPVYADLMLGGWTSLEAWAYVVLFFVRGYFDFSGYTDIALGAARLFGIRLMENFDWPLLAPDIAQFWRRWHMTLAGWCQIYVYQPALGLTRQPYAAIYSVFLVMALWHGLSWNWVGWGLWHGTGVSALMTWNRFKRRRRALKRVAAPNWLGTVVTVLFVSAGNAFTSTEHLGFAAGLRLFAKLFGVEIAP